MTKYETAATLLELMYTANLADTDQAEPWQTPIMAQDLFRDLSHALRKVLGDDLYLYLLEGDLFVDAKRIEEAEAELEG